jgi:hypothetical protein
LSGDAYESPRNNRLISKPFLPPTLTEAHIQHWLDVRFHGQQLLHVTRPYELHDTHLLVHVLLRIHRGAEACSFFCIPGDAVDRRILDTDTFFVERTRDGQDLYYCKDVAPQRSIVYWYTVTNVILIDLRTPNTATLLLTY